MASNRSINKIPYESLPVEIQGYPVEKLEIFRDEWNSDLDAETQHLCIEDFSKEITSPSTSAAVASASSGSGTAATEEKIQRNISSEEKLVDLAVVGDVINIMLEYNSPDNMRASHAEAPLVSTLFNTIKIRKLEQLRVLLTAIVSGRPDEVKVILDKDPSLLYEKLEEGQFVTAPSGHKFNLKPYQAALSVDDTQMAALVKSYFATLDDEKEADNQSERQCPDGWEVAEEMKWSPIFDQHDKLARAIRDSKVGDITSSHDPDYIVTVKKGSLVEQKLLEFWRLLDATLNAVVTEGMRPFNPNLLSRALQLYDDDKHYEDYFGGRWDDPRALLFVQKVIGYDGIQRFMPVNYVQAFQDGLSTTANKLKNNTPQGRSTRFKIYRSGNLDPVGFYPLHPRSVPGFNFVIYAALLGSVRAAQRFAWGEAGRRFQSLCQSKTTCLQNLRPGVETVDLSRQNRLGLA